MTPKQVADRLTKLIKKYGGWIDEYDDEVIRFPTPYQKEQFLKEWEA